MGMEEEVIDKHLQICKVICNDKGYSKLDYLREEIKKEVLKSFEGNGCDLKKVSQILNITDNAIFHYLDAYVMSRGSRSFGWPSYCEGDLRAEIAKAVNSPH